MVKLTGRMRSELRALQKSPGLWHGVEPDHSDADLAFYLSNGLARHLGTGKGYAITDAGREALSKAEGE